MLADWIQYSAKNGEEERGRIIEGVGPSNPIMVTKCNTWVTRLSPVTCYAIGLIQPNSAVLLCTVLVLGWCHWCPVRNNTELQHSLLPSRHEGPQNILTCSCLPNLTSSGAEAWQMHNTKFYSILGNEVYLQRPTWMILYRNTINTSQM